MRGAGVTSSLAKEDRMAYRIMDDCEEVNERAVDLSIRIHMNIPDPSFKY